MASSLLLMLCLAKVEFLHRLLLSEYLVFDYHCVHVGRGAAVANVLALVTLQACAAFALFVLSCHITAVAA